MLPNGAYACAFQGCKEVFGSLEQRNDHMTRVKHDACIYCKPTRFIPRVRMAGHCEDKHNTIHPYGDQQVLKRAWVFGVKPL